MDALRRYAGADLPPGSDIDGELTQIVIGETIRGGRRAIVTELSGDFEAHNGGDAIYIEFDGYIVIDVASAMQVDAHVVTLVEVGNESARADLTMTGIPE